MRMRRIPCMSQLLLIAALLVGLVGAGAWDAAPAPAAQPAGVPAEYADLYAMLAAKLRAIDAHITPRWSGERHDVVFSAELLAANSNQGEAILRPEAWQVVTFNLDRLQLVGVRGVKVAIKYPILVPGFPRSGEYLEFFKRLSVELKRRNLKFLAQMTPGFREPVFSALPVAGHYAGLTLERYTREARGMAEVIIREIRPDYLTIANEPHTAQENTGLSFTVANYTGFVQQVLVGLERSGVLIGAGAGTWDDLAYAQSLARTTLDYLDMHIYPINHDYVIDRAIRFADVARRAGKKVALGEAWLYKTRDHELRGQAVAAAPALFARDVFGFWEPLDVEFITLVGRLSHFQKIDFTSFFWSRHFYGYVEYGESTRGLRPAELFRQANLAAARGMMADPPRLTRTGIAFQRLAAR
ncbi:MAG: hypothetical protein FJX73_04655 [Armatimonadetes bacterium]|nr:hypothetical protein [Armatimonadota bacterium]